MEKVNIKISKEIHNLIVKISEETGINIYKLAELGIQKLIDEYEKGLFKDLISQRTKIRRDGQITRN
jgi:hypothetical protein